MTDNWRGLYDLVKNMKLSYRVSLKNLEINSYNVFRKKVRMYDIYQFS